MIRKVVSVAFVIGVLVALMSAAPTRSVALLATPSEGTPQAGPSPTEVDVLCEVGEGIPGIVVEPNDLRAGVVESADDPGHFLWVVKITIDPGSCYRFHSQEGPVVLFVHSGSIEYGVHSEATPAATVGMGHQNDAATPVALDTFVTLNSGDWLTQDRAAWFTYRNPGPDTAVISMAAYVGPFDDLDDSSGGKG